MFEGIDEAELGEIGGYHRWFFGLWIMISIWEKESFTAYDVIIVGAGISGLSTAISLKEKAPHLQVLVLERGLLPTGASTKNAGFACFGSLSELCQDRQMLGDAGMLSLVQMRWEGLQKTLNRLGADRIDYQQKGGYELCDQDTTHYLAHLDEINDLLSSYFHEAVFSIQDRKIGSFGFSQVDHLVFNHLEGQLHTGKLMNGLWEYANTIGVKILTGAEVINYTKESSGVHVETLHFSFFARSLVLCTNAFTKKLLKNEFFLKPGRGMVMLVKPAKALKFSGTFHYQEGYYYFRDFGDKILFGGGRNLDFSSEETLEFGVNSLIKDKLDQYLSEVIIPDTKYETELLWSGIMAFGHDKMPLIDCVDEGIFVGVRLGGMGVAIGSMVGESLAELVLKSNF